jgi:hypothetical protein
VVVGLLYLVACRCDQRDADLDNASVQFLANRGDMPRVIVVVNGICLFWRTTQPSTKSPFLAKQSEQAPAWRARLNRYSLESQSPFVFETENTRGP